MFQIFQHTESYIWCVLVSRWHSHYGNWLGEYIYIYIYIYVFIFLYIYMCVCVCGVCVCTSEILFKLWKVINLKHFSEIKLEIWESAINVPMRYSEQGFRKIWKFMLDARKSHFRCLERSDWRSYYRFYS